MAIEPYAENPSLPAGAVQLAPNKERVEFIPQSPEEARGAGCADWGCIAFLKAVAFIAAVSWIAQQVWEAAQ